MKGAWYAAEQWGHLLHHAAILHRSNAYPTAAAVALLGRKEFGAHEFLLDQWRTALRDRDWAGHARYMWTLTRRGPDGIDLLDSAREKRPTVFCTRRTIMRGSRTTSGPSCSCTGTADLAVALAAWTDKPPLPLPDFDFELFP